MNTALYKALNQAGIAFAFPERKIHLQSSVVPVEKLVD
jgi:small-conductance mechanosensitive channel